MCECVQAPCDWEPHQAFLLQLVAVAESEARVPPSDSSYVQVTT